MNSKCPVCNKPLSEGCNCLKSLNDAQKKSESKQVLIEDGTMSTFGFNNVSEIKVHN